VAKTETTEKTEAAPEAIEETAPAAETAETSEAPAEAVAEPADSPTPEPESEPEPGVVAPPANTENAPAAGLVAEVESVAQSIVDQERAAVAEYMRKFWSRVYGEMVIAGHSAQSAIEHANRYVNDLLDHVKGLTASD
jgi:hypothetical protein